MLTLMHAIWVGKVELAERHLSFVTIQVILNGQVVREELDHDPGHRFPHRTSSELGQILNLKNERHSKGT